MKNGLASLTMENLPDIGKAKLPKVYVAARVALANCSQIDECKDWANKAEAIASYAKQAEDDELRKFADRIQARAIRRCGELLRQIPRSPGGRPSKGLLEELGSAAAQVSRSGVAKAAGLSTRQKKTALRVAGIPERDFEDAVESKSPPSVTALAERGKERKPLFDLKGRDPAEFRLATSVLGSLTEFAGMASRSDPGAVARGAFPRERRKAQGQIAVLIRWLRQLNVHFAKEKKP